MGKGLRKCTYADLSFNAEGNLLVKPNADGGALLQQAEDEVDRRQQSLSRSHGV